MIDVLIFFAFTVYFYNLFKSTSNLNMYPINILTIKLKSKVFVTINMNV